MTDIWDDIEKNKMENDADWGLTDREKLAQAEKKIEKLEGRKRDAVEPDWVPCTIHKFKSNIGRYMRQAEQGQIKGVMLKRYDRIVGFYMPYDPYKK